MLRLLNHKQLNYRKTDVDGGDLGENANEEDIFNMSQKKFVYYILDKTCSAKF